MKTYLVTWKIQIHAENPRKAAEKALETQRNPESTAVFFKVFGENNEYGVDLLTDEKEEIL